MDECRTNDRSRSYGVRTKMNEEYEKIEFKTWQELAKFVIDGGEAYIIIPSGEFEKITFNESVYSFNVLLRSWVDKCYTKKQKNNRRVY